MTYRMLPQEEWPRLIDIMAKQGKDVPNPAASSAAVAEDDDGNIVGVLFFQLVMHMEPLILENPYVRFDRLAQCLHGSVSQFKGLAYYAFSESDTVAGMAARMGFEELPYKVHVKEVV